MENDVLSLLPEQYTGKQIVAEADLEKNEAEILTIYVIARARLLNINQWHKYAGVISGKFQLVSKEGEEIERYPAEGDYIRIDIPGPGSDAGGGFDWVVIELIKEISNPALQAIGFRVRPVPNPFNNKEAVAHFYTAEATSAFMIIRTENVIRSEIVDSNLKPNNEGSSFADKVRQLAVGVGAMSIFSKLQWQHLAVGLINF